MIFKNKYLYHFSIIVSFLCFMGFVYISYVSFFIVNEKFINIDGATYINQVREDKFTQDLSNKLTKNCTNRICEVQKMLNYVTNIPYKVNPSVARSGKNVIKNNYGDCDDKSNLLISMLNSQGYEAYFVFVPKHVFIAVNMKQKLSNKKALYLNETPFYILETTAKNSAVGFPFKYKREDVKAVIDPFENEKVRITSIVYKY